MVVIGDQYIDAEFAHNIGAQAILVARAERIAHLERLGQWQSQINIVPALDMVQVG
jgi:phosphoglycolate phosphatase-like HAD superfamily hydrolase